MKELEQKLKTPSNYDDEQMYDLGLAAQALLTNDTFKYVMSVLGGEAMDILVKTEPKEKHQREDCYFLYKALESVNATLINWVQQAQQIELENTPEEGH